MNLIAVICLFLMLTGCSSLKPIRDDSRTFVLVSQGTVRAATPVKGVGIGRVEMPGYLKLKAIAIRQGVEVRYSNKYFWGESLDAGIQRALGADLGFTNVFSSFWRRDQVDFEIYVTVNCFDLDEFGTAHLKAFWRLAKPGASEIIYAGIFETHREGPRLSENPAAASVSLSGTIGQLADQIRHRIDLAQNPQKD
jgi:uncharacterized lipoprotein YmbA